MKQFITLTFMTFVCASAYAQFEVSSSGRVLIGTESPDVATIPATDRDTVPRLHIMGPFDSFGAGARMAFGDAASVFAKNVQIGELSDEDSDILWLHGKHGLYYTHNPYANDTIFYYDDQRSNTMMFNCDVKTSGLFITSDSNDKENIEALDNASGQLFQLTPVQYSLKSDSPELPRATFSSDKSSSKDIADAAFYENFYREQTEQARTRYGLLAQEVKEVFPNLVMEDSEGHLSVDYIGLIPILIDAVKTLNAKVEELENPAVEEDKEDTATNAGIESVANSTASAFLGQNAPNPANGNTVISYRLPEGCTAGQLCVCDLQGKLMRSYPLSETNGAITLSVNDFSAGMYLYALVADGQEIAVKRMILTK